MGLTSLMKLLMVMFAILLQFYYFASNVVEGTREVKLGSQIKSLNKTPIKSIQTEEGDIFDCIDINKQPSLDHHLLKNHVVKTRPTFHSFNTMSVDDHEVVSSSPTSPFNSSMKPLSEIAIMRKLNCPEGTVPIRRTSKEDLIRAKIFSQSLLVHSTNIGVRNDLRNPDEGQFLSIAKTQIDSGIAYVGISAHISTYNPPIVENQMTTAQLWIENGIPKEEFGSLQAGWMIAPSLYGDNRTRFFVKWQVDDSGKSEGCYNLLCPGFVQVSNEVPIGGAIILISEYDNPEKQSEIPVAIYLDDNGDWWLQVGNFKIGYWPSELDFPKITFGSSLIAWGGLAIQLGQVTEATIVPPTGNGHWPESNFNKYRECYMRRMKVIPAASETKDWEDPTRTIIDIDATETECSNAIYHGRLNDVYQHTLGFGGPGGNCTF